MLPELDYDQEFLGVYLHSRTLRHILADQVVRGNPVHAWRFGDSDFLPCGAEAVLAPHDSEFWVYVPGNQPFVVDATQFSGDPAKLGSLIERHGLQAWGCDNERRRPDELQTEVYEARNRNDRRVISTWRWV